MIIRETAGVWSSGNQSAAGARRVSEYINLGYCIGPRDDHMRRELKHMYVSVRGYMFITATGSLFSGKQTVKTLPSFSLLASVHETHLQSSLSSGINYKPLFLSTFGVINPHHRLH